MEKDPSTLNDTLATGSTEVDLNTLMDALATLQTVDLHGLQGRLNNAGSNDFKNGEDGQDASVRLAESMDWKMKYTDLKEKYDSLKAQLRTMEQTASLEQKSELVLLQQRIESDEESLKSLKEKLKEYMNELEKKEERLLIQQKEMEEVQKAKDDALIRLSQQMGQQLSEGNPNIMDLSDQNRPSKLGEMYSELYDNEWTNAFEVLTETFHFDEKRAIELLLKILWESSKHASDVTQSTMKMIENLLAGSSEGPTPDCKRLLREARKHVDIKKADGLFQEFVREKLTGLVGRIYLEKEKVEIYSKKCFQLCWLMSIQEPPVVLSGDPERGAQFDYNLYRHYTNSGDNVDYVVWPALLLHKNGPVLAKGVIEPSTSPRAKSASNIGRLTAVDDKSIDSRSQTQYDKVQESTSGSNRMDKKQYMHQARYDEKLRESSFGSDRMDTTHYEHQARNYDRLREPSFGPDRIDTTRYEQQAKNYEKLRESSFGSHRMDTSWYEHQARNNEKLQESSFGFDKIGRTQYGYQVQTDATLLLNLRHDLMMTPTNLADGDKCRVHLPTTTSLGQRQLSQRMQVNQHHSFRNMIDKERFQRFCENVRSFKESELRVIYRTVYDRYYMLYISQKCDI